jgi:hypothetical protein
VRRLYGALRAPFYDKSPWPRSFYAKTASPRLLGPPVFRLSHSRRRLMAPTSPARRAARVPDIRTIIGWAVAARKISKRRIDVLDARIEEVKARMAARRKRAVALVVALGAAAEEEGRARPRRVIRRSLGKWRGSAVGADNSFSCAFFASSSSFFLEAAHLVSYQ